jgi:hypothetical protein
MMGKESNLGRADIVRELRKFYPDMIPQIVHSRTSTIEKLWYIHSFAKRGLFNCDIEKVLNFPDLPHYVMSSGEVVHVTKSLSEEVEEAPNLHKDLPAEAQSK